MLQIKETKKEKLFRQYEVGVKKSDLMKTIDKEVIAVQPSVEIAGFRKGKVPLDIVKKNLGEKITLEVVQKLMQDAVEKIQNDSGLKVANRPEVVNINYQDVVALKADLKAEIAFNLLPTIPAIDMGAIKLTRFRPHLDEAGLTERVKENLNAIAQNYRDRKDVTDRQQTKKDDIVVIDFEGFVDGKAFQGGKANDFELVLGSGQFIAGFEDQLVGKKIGTPIDVHVTFPKHYHDESLSEKPALFKTTIKGIKEFLPLTIDNALAKKAGFDNVKEMETMMTAQINRQKDRDADELLKRQLLDKMNQLVEFELPEKMVENEFNNVFGEIKHAFEHDHLDDDDKGKDLKTLEKEYRAIARRRIKLGLVLNDIGEKAAIKVTEEEMRQAIMRQAMQYPPKEREQFLKAVGQHQHLQVQISLPIFEQKVVEHIFTQISITDKDLSPDEFKKKAEAIHRASL